MRAPISTAEGSFPADAVVDAANSLDEGPRRVAIAALKERLPREYLVVRNGYLEVAAASRATTIHG